MGQDHRILNSGYHPQEFFKEMWQTISSRRDMAWRSEESKQAWQLLLGGVHHRAFHGRTGQTAALCFHPHRHHCAQGDG